MRCICLHLEKAMAGAPSRRIPALKSSVVAAVETILIIERVYCYGNLWKALKRPVPQAMHQSVS